MTRKTGAFSVHYLPLLGPPSVFPSHEAHPTTPCDYVHFSLPNPNSASLGLEATTKPQGWRWKRDMLSDSRTTSSHGCLRGS